MPEPSTSVRHSPKRPRSDSRWRQARRLSHLLGGLLLGLTSISAGRAEAPAGSGSSLWQRYATAAAVVRWQPWTPASIAQAKAENRLIFVHLGDVSHDLTRAMHEQTFGNAATAAFLNEHFVCVLADRAEHAKLAALAAAYVQGVKQMAGLPLHLWLVPDDLAPAEGASYLPPGEEWGKESFMKVAERTAAAWRADPGAVRATAAESVLTLGAWLQRPPAREHSASSAILARAISTVTAALHPATGGFGEPPHPPQPELLRFLLSREGEPRATALAALHALAGTAVRDPLDGGFFRATVDGAGLLPTFQKHAIDQVRLAAAYLHGARVGDDPVLGAVARGTLDYLLTTLTREDGAVLAAEFTPAEAVHAAYGWTYDELKTVLGPDTHQVAPQLAATASGNVPVDADPGQAFRGLNLLRAAPAAFDTSPRGVQLTTARQRLLAARRARSISPERDRNIVTSTQGLAIAALARASAQFADERYLAAARRLERFLGEQLVLDHATGTLRRLAGSAEPAVATDYAAILHGLRVLESVAPDPSRAALTQRIEQRLLRDFGDSTTGHLFFAAAAPAMPARWLRLFSPPASTADPLSAEALAIVALPSPACDTLIGAALADLDEALSAGTMPADLLWALSTGPSAP